MPKNKMAAPNIQKPQLYLSGIQKISGIRVYGV
jgi:hypothetical protein